MSPNPGQLIGPIPDGRDPQAYDRLRRRVLWALPTGLYVLGSRAGNRRNLMTISFVNQVCVEPKLVAVGVESSSVTHGLLDEGQAFALSLLPRGERTVVRRFVKPVADASFDEEAGTGTMNEQPVRLAPSGAPVLEVAVAWIDCAVRHRLALGSHSLFVGEVVDCGVGTPPGVDQPADGAGGSEDALDQLLRMEDTRMSYGG